MEKLGTSIKDARLISIQELENLGCSRLSYSCSGAPSWVYSITYWVGEAYSETGVWNVDYYGNFNFDTYIDLGHGVRPVITVSKNQILGIKSKIKPVANGDINNIGTVVTIGDEQFYTIGTEGDNVKLLSKYNLYVGGIYYDETYQCINYGDEATGIQDSSMLGPVSGQLTRNGTTSFSLNNYWGNSVNSYPAYVYNDNSDIYNYLENYKKYLGVLGVSSLEVRPINYNELISLGCDDDRNSCDNAPKWLSSTSYWTGSAVDSSDIFIVNTDYGFYGLKSIYPSYGVRPVVVISKEYF